MMMRQLIRMGALLALLLSGVGMAQADLVTIGTATYNGSDYNLIWDDDNNGNSVVWLDYTNTPANWADQNTWAAGLDSFLTYNIDAAYSVSWDDDAWRLSYGQFWPYPYDAPIGYVDIPTGSELYHLFTEELPGYRIGQFGEALKWTPSQGQFSHKLRCASFF